MKNTLTYICIILSLLLLLQWQCGRKSNAGYEKQLKDSKTADSLAHARENALIDSNMALMVDMGLRDIEANRKIDSLTQIIHQGKQNLTPLDFRMKHLIETVREYASSRHDTVATDQADTLSMLYANAKDNVVYLLSAYDAKDSVFVSQVQYKDSVIVAQQETIAQLDKNFQQQSIIISNLQTSLDSAIRAGKRKNVLRTIFEAVLVVGLIFKK